MRSTRSLVRWLGGISAVVVLALVVSTLAFGRGATPVSAQTPGPTPVEIHAAHGTSYVPALEGKRPLFILALGSDARPGQSITGERSDSIHLIGIDLKTKAATLLGFPRDSWVSIPGHGTSKINDAMAFGGPNLMVATIEHLTGIRVDFWLLTSFTGMIRMVDNVGGITVDIPYAMHDRYSGANFGAGRHHLSGGQALALARNRHDTPRGDFSRSLNQGLLLRSALAELRKDFRDRPDILFTWLTTLWRNVKTDLSTRTLLDLGLTATQVSPSRVSNLVVPGTTGTVGSASVVFISSSAHAIYQDMRKDGVVG
ncbi:MAG TPA: LCP family protein [Actinomycetota bacterium]|nr:LCP family protein [Actinomycetota bacterium]